MNSAMKWLFSHKQERTTKLLQLNQLLKSKDGLENLSLQILLLKDDKKCKNL